MWNRRELMQVALGLPVTSAVLSVGTSAQEAWPTRMITLVVPFPPGGTSDLAARPLAAFLQERFGQNAIVENKAGGAGAVGHAHVARAQPDGYTILVALSSLPVIPESNRLLGQPATYEMDQFIPLARLLADPSLLVVHKQSPWASAADFIAAAKEKPGQFNYGSSGTYGPGHLAMEMFLQAAQLKMQHVPYRGAGPSANALLAQDVPALCTVQSVVKGQLEAGTFRVLAQWTPERDPAFPDVPTMRELGYGEVTHVSWAGVFAPRGTPEHATSSLRQAIGAFIQQPASVERFAAAGGRVNYLDAPAFAEFLKDDTARLLKVVRTIGPAS
jgi:tripartite-type tricarboxylate transporter receptor subunit TctC